MPRTMVPDWTWVAAGVDDHFRTKLGAALKLVDDQGSETSYGGNDNPADG
ncbi:hypothetical protein [Enhygromyxa salina]|uniref:Uncharacterized protein n=1 Tax=Enhygromyxa salina TaxID=215803 RepID=A0A2S9YTX5_9BACT|nr:hypothetical protein [Enhygromyxa salina]PRQ08530.1 hypothetical protein ENSA7_18160 [Enhygromyxa salina]